MYDLPNTRIFRATRAIQAVAYDVSTIRHALHTGAQAEFDQMSAEYRDALERLAGVLESTLNEFADPIWEGLTDETQKLCREAGMK